MRLQPSEKLRVIARMFTRPVFSRIAATGSWERGLDFLPRLRLVRPCAKQSLSELFESAWLELRISYRNEYVYKTELANRLIFGRHSPRTAALHVELPVGRSIADIAIFNGTSTAYEIKTEFDSPKRLETQTADYLRVFDRVFVVSHPNCADAYAAIVPKSVGVLSLNASGSLRVIKAAAPNRQNVHVESIFRCLRRSEYVAIIESIVGQKLTYPNGIIARKCENYFSELKPEEAHNFFVEAMQRRKTDPGTVGFVSRLPRCLTTLGYATPLSARQRTTMLSALSAKINVAIA